MGQASTFGYLNSFVGVGAVSGAVFLASLKPGTDLRKILFRNTLIFATGLLLFSYTTSLPLALVFLAIAGFGMMSQTTLSNTIIQTTVAPAMRGRVISFYAMAFFGMQPIGGLIIGSVSHAIGAPLTIMLQGIATLIIALVFLPYLRHDLFKRKHRMKVDQLEEQSIETTS
jgi:MFS family permease